MLSLFEFLQYVLVLSLAATALRIRQRMVALSGGVANFGSSIGRVRVETVEIARVLLSNYIAHQRASFALVWVSAAVGLALVSMIVGGVATGSFSYAAARASLALIPDGLIGLGAWRLYRDASSRVERLLRDSAFPVEGH